MCDRPTVAVVENTPQDCDRVERAVSQATQHAEQRYRSLFEPLPIAVYRSMFDGTILDANKAFASLVGLPGPEAAVSASTLAFFVDPTEHEGLIRTLQATGEVHDRVVRLPRAGGGR